MVEGGKRLIIWMIYSTTEQSRIGHFNCRELSSGRGERESIGFGGFERGGHKEHTGGTRRAWHRLIEGYRVEQKQGGEIMIDKEINLLVVSPGVCTLQYNMYMYSTYIPTYALN